jgi:hypothetical protein
LATMATPPSTPAAATNTSDSVGLTPNNRDCSDLAQRATRACLTTASGARAPGLAQHALDRLQPAHRRIVL